MIKLVMFDWNGVLIADSRACFESDNNVLEKFGGSKIGIKKWRETIVIPSIEFYTLHGASRKKISNNPKKWAEIFHNFYERRACKIRTRSFAKMILKWLSKNKIKCTILSNYTIDGINKHLKRLKIDNYFSDVLANSAKDTTLKNKNKLKRLKNYLLGKNYKKKEVCIIGDSPEEIEIGKSLGLMTIAITNGFYSTKRLKNANPDHIINNLKEIKKIIEHSS